MADTIDTRPGVVPADLRTGPDGAVPDLPRRAWVWCRGPLGDRSDFRSDRLDAARRRGYEPVPDYPVNFGESAAPVSRRPAREPAELAGTFDTGGATTGTAVTVPTGDTTGGAEPSPVDNGDQAAEPDTATDPTAADGDDQDDATTTTTRKGRANR